MNHKNTFSNWIAGIGFASIGFWVFIWNQDLRSVGGDGRGDIRYLLLQHQRRKIISQMILCDDEPRK